MKPNRTRFEIMHDTLTCIAEHSPVLGSVIDRIIGVAYGTGQPIRDGLMQAGMIEFIMAVDANDGVRKHYTMTAKGLFFKQHCEVVREVMTKLPSPIHYEKEK